MWIDPVLFWIFPGFCYFSLSKFSWHFERTFSLVDFGVKKDQTNSKQIYIKEKDVLFGGMKRPLFSVVIISYKNRSASGFPANPAENILEWVNVGQRTLNNNNNNSFGEKSDERQCQRRQHHRLLSTGGSSNINTTNIVWAANVVNAVHKGGKICKKHHNLHWNNSSNNYSNNNSNNNKCNNIWQRIQQQG